MSDARENPGKDGTIYQQFMRLPVFIVYLAIAIIAMFLNVLASILRAGFAGRLVGFNFVESAITDGLCMANMDGTGDIAALSASRRMALMPFDRSSTSYRRRIHHYPLRNFRAVFRR
jgi:Na+/citrate or Na+/malate symporter